MALRVSELSSDIRFGFKVPIWDPRGSRASEWWPRLLLQLDDLPQEFESIWLSDHLMPGVPWMAATTDTLEGWTTAAYLAALYPRLKVGHLVLANSFRNPVLLAKMSSTLHLISGGRLVLGLGAGWMESEYKGLGIPFPPTNVRLAQLDEALRIIRGVWAGEPLDHTGLHYSSNGEAMEPAPHPAPPIVLGTGGDQIGLRLVARHADWWNSPGLPVAAFRSKVSLLRQRCDEAGRDPASLLLTWQGQRVAVADSTEEAVRQMESNPMAARSAHEAAVVGTPELVAEMLSDYVAAGARYFMLRFADAPSLEGVRRFAEEVIPRLTHG